MFNTEEIEALRLNEIAERGAMTRQYSRDIIYKEIADEWANFWVWPGRIQETFIDTEDLYGR